MTYRFDLFLEAIVTAMFLAGCVLFVLGARERSQERKRWGVESGG